MTRREEGREEKIGKRKTLERKSGNRESRVNRWIDGSIHKTFLSVKNHDRTF